MELLAQRQVAGRSPARACCCWSPPWAARRNCGVVLRRGPGRQDRAGCASRLAGGAGQGRADAQGAARRATWHAIAHAGRSSRRAAARRRRSKRPALWHVEALRDRLQSTGHGRRYDRRRAPRGARGSGRARRRQPADACWRCASQRSRRRVRAMAIARLGGARRASRRPKQCVALLADDASAPIRPPVIAAILGSQGRARRRWPKRSTARSCRPTRPSWRFAPCARAAREEPALVAALTTAGGITDGAARAVARAS